MQILGATCDNKFTGSFGTGCFSFFPTKNITTTEGGMLSTNNKSHYEKIKLIIAHGIDKNLKKHFWPEGLLCLVTILDFLII